MAKALAKTFCGGSGKQMGTHGCELKPQAWLPFTVTLGKCLPSATQVTSESPSHPLHACQTPSLSSFLTDLKPQAWLQEAAREVLF